MSQTLPQPFFRDEVRKLERILGLLHDGEMSCCGITLSQCHALVEIGRTRAISLNALATLLNLDNSTTSRTVQNLVSAGLARRETDPQDRRMVVIALAPEGEALFQKVECGVADQFERVWSRVPADKRNQVAESLRLLLDAMDETKKPDEHGLSMIRSIATDLPRARR